MSNQLQTSLQRVRLKYRIWLAPIPAIVQLSQKRESNAVGRQSQMAIVGSMEVNTGITMKKINGFWFFTLSIVGLIILVSVVRLPPLDNFFALNKDNSLGDAFNGLTAPFIGLISAYLLYLALMAQNDTNRLQLQSLEIQRKQLDVSTIAEALSRVDSMIDNFKYFEVDGNGDIVYSNSGPLAMRDVMKAAGRNGKIMRMHKPEFESMAFIFNRVLNLESIISNADIGDDVKRDFMQHIEMYGKILARYAAGIDFIYDSERGDKQDPVYLDFQKFWQRFRKYVSG